MRRAFASIMLLLLATGADGQTAGGLSLAELFEAANIAASRGAYNDAISGSD